MNLHEHQKFAVGVVKRAGEIFSKNIQSPEIIRQKAAGDMATNGDLEIEKFIGEAIRETYPDHDFITEESDGKSTGAAYEWILDPVDGTKYYARRMPLCAISLALRIDGKLSLGVVYSPLMGQLFSAASGVGASLNGGQFYCSRQSELAEAMVCAELPSRHSPKEDRDRALGQLRAIIDSVQRVRVIGVSSLGLCWTARGGFDSYVNLGSASHIWDVAAGMVVLEESGAKLDLIDGRIVAGSPHLQDGLIRLLQED
jgi:fructose-1,6-bisphosphatase/inositol monophosphatase family enzyme